MSASAKRTDRNAMPTIPECEARALLAQPLLCEDADHWKRIRGPVPKCSTGGGLVDQFGKASGLIVELGFRWQHGRCYVFSVMKRNRYGLDRVYQLEVNQASTPPGSAHKRPHEHWGGSRFDGPADWMTWNFDELLSYFCSQTNVSFSPKPTHPSTTLGAS